MSLGDTRTINSIVDQAEQVAGLPTGTIRDVKQRTVAQSFARHVAYYVAKIETRQSWRRIAEAMNVSDHKAIMYGFNKISVLLAEKNPDTMKMVAAVAAGPEGTS